MAFLPDAVWAVLPCIVFTNAPGLIQPPHSIPRLISDRARLGVDGRSSSPLEPSSAAREPKPFTLVLGLGIGCSIIMSGLVLQEEQHRPPFPITGKHSRNNGRDRTVGGTENPSFTVSDRDAAAAAVRADCSAKPPTLQPVALPIATPERRRLAPTEFVTLPSPASAAVPPLSDGDNDRESRYLLLAMEVPDPVLAKLVHDFDHGGVDSGPRGLSSSSCPSPSCSKPPPSAACNSGSDGIGAEDVEVPHAPSATVCRNGGGSGVAGSDEGQPAPADPVCMVKPATGTKQREDDASQRLSISAGYPSSASESGAAGRGREETGERSEAFRGGDGDSGDSESGGGKASGGGGGREKSQGVALPKKVEEVDVPDGEWRRYGRGVERINNLVWIWTPCGSHLHSLLSHCDSAGGGLFWHWLCSRFVPFA